MRPFTIDPFVHIRKQVVIFEQTLRCLLALIYGDTPLKLSMNLLYFVALNLNISDNYSKEACNNTYAIVNFDCCTYYRP